MFCSKCGEQVQDDGKFCQSCGQPTAGIAEVAVAPQSFAPPAAGQAPAAGQTVAVVSARGLLKTIAGIGGILAIIFMFLPWVSLSWVFGNKPAFMWNPVELFDLFRMISNDSAAPVLVLVFFAFWTVSFIMIIVGLIMVFVKSHKAVLMTGLALAAITALAWLIFLALINNDVASIFSQSQYSLFELFGSGIFVVPIGPVATAITAVITTILVGIFGRKKKVL
ncbi:MAG: zinc ribbon domain-containing protein [Coriobacteriia bacterium]|nr:zinc ribbon domain-containing protein [Coriobacteriia bacterium]